MNGDLGQMGIGMRYRCVDLVGEWGWANEAGLGVCWVCAGCVLGVCWV